MEPQGKVALVTGAGSGIGKGVALGVLAGGISGDAGWSAPGAAGTGGDESGVQEKQALIVPTDVRDPAAVRALFAQDQGSVRSARRAVQ